MRPSRRISISSPSSKHSSRSCVTSRIGRLNSARTCRSTCVQLRAQRRVQAARRLVEQQQLRRADQRARNRAALLLAARDFVRPPPGHVRQVESLQHFVDAPVPLQARQAVRREHQVCAQRHVREQRVVLEHVTAVAPPRRQVDAGGAVEQDLVVQQDAAGIRAARSRRWNRA